MVKEKEMMTSPERIKAILREQPVDRVPLWNFVLGFCAKNIGYPVASIYNNPEKSFYPATELATCPNMKKTTLEKVLWALERLQHEVKVPDHVRTKAYRAVEKMTTCV